MLKANVLARTWIAIPLLLGVASCSQFTHLNCDPHSWYGLGIRDGARGESHRIAAKYQRTCKHQSVLFDRRAYETGFAEGHVEYCVGQNGFHLGVSGVHARRVCKNDDAVVFNEGYEAGRALRRAVFNLERAKHPELYVANEPFAQRRNFHIEHVIDPSIRSTRYYNFATEVASLSRLEYGTNHRISSPSRLRTLIGKCENAIKDAQERGFYTNINCSGYQTSASNPTY